MNVAMSWPQYLRREVTIEGRVVPLRARECELISCLLLRRGCTLSLADLIGMIWPNPDDEPGDAAQAIYAGLYDVRRLFPGLVEMRGRAICGRFRSTGYMIPLPSRRDGDGEDLLISRRTASR